mmetsp:Transcript_68505/g.121196  ORF Transcript_68505/g.121196 Transcript_68505/m.121196 type:complete len:233 (+) Transcript_68505:912-1610(+)
MAGSVRGEGREKESTLQMQNNPSWQTNATNAHHLRLQDSSHKPSKTSRLEIVPETVYSTLWWDLDGPCTQAHVWVLCRYPLLTIPTPLAAKVLFLSGKSERHRCISSQVSLGCVHHTVMALTSTCVVCILSYGGRAGGGGRGCICRFEESLVVNGGHPVVVGPTQTIIPSHPRQPGQLPGPDSGYGQGRDRGDRCGWKPQGYAHHRSQKKCICLDVQRQCSRNDQNAPHPSL